uniref:Copper transporter n=1 Tax=Noctiluca scintillans TaxID=2966 RepID=A0A7S1AJP5_NOCSC|mmetsp:Transcript_47426/g.125804  ORF Transcript_47426/g.125804 Transcript_47426/m.125804 type:complete len:368 (+) Transcript_47426:40-1143(+)
MQLLGSVTCLSMVLIPVVGLNVVQNPLVVAPVTGALGHNVSAPDGIVSLPMDLARMSSDCNCRFEGYCTCEGARAFMSCIRDACSQSSCDCDRSYHFDNACNHLAGTCPSLGLQCSTTEVSCMKRTYVPQSVPFNTSRDQPREARPANRAPNPVQPSPVQSTPGVTVQPIDRPSLRDRALQTSSQSGVSWWEAHRSLLVWWTLSAAVHSLIILAFAFVYNRYRITLAFKPGKGAHDQGKFRFGLFDCFNSSQLCLLGCCCPCLRWPDTVDKVMRWPSYWLLVAVMILESVFDGLCHGLLGLLFVLFGCYMRQRMRSKYQMENTSGIMVLDLLAWCCCTPCAIVQEARHCELQRNGVKKHKVTGSGDV